MTRKAFGRPKKYKLHRDHNAFVSRPDLPAQTVAELGTTGSEAMQRWLRDRDLMPAPRTYYAKVPANFNDPRVVFYLLDTIVQSERGTYLRAAYLQFTLNQRVPQYHWDAGVIGRMLAGINTTCVEAYTGWDEEGHALDYVEDESMVPFAKGRDTSGYYYVIDPQGGNEGLVWLLDARQRMSVLANHQMTADLHGEFDAQFGHVSQPANWYTDVFGGAIRSPDGFKAQLAPGEYFEGSAPNQKSSEPSFRAGYTVA